MSKTKENAITQAAILELEKLSLLLDAELEVMANMPIEEVEDGLRRMGLDPHQELPARIQNLTSEEVGEQHARIAPDAAVEGRGSDMFAWELGSSIWSQDSDTGSTKSHLPPQFGERILILVLKKDELINVPGDLAEEYTKIAARHGEGYAKLWYYKQVAASAWPLILKVFRWGSMASVRRWLRRNIG